MPGNILSFLLKIFFKLSKFRPADVCPTRSAYVIPKNPNYVGYFGKLFHFCISLFSCKNPYFFGFAKIEKIIVFIRILRVVVFYIVVALIQFLIAKKIANPIMFNSRE